MRTVSRILDSPHLLSEYKIIKWKHYKEIFCDEGLCLPLSLLACQRGDMSPLSLLTTGGLSGRAQI